MNRNQTHEFDWSDFIQADPRISNGKPVVKGTTLTVEGVLHELAAGRTIAEMMQRHPELTREAMRAIFDLAADSVHRKYPGPTQDEFFEGPEWTVIED